jgi:hypothetical protein
MVLLKAQCICVTAAGMSTNDKHCGQCPLALLGAFKILYKSKLIKYTLAEALRSLLMDENSLFTIC